MVQAEQIAHEVDEAASPNEVMFGNAQRVMRDIYDVRLSVSEAQRLVRLAHDADVGDITQFRQIVDPTKPGAIEFAESFRASRNRSPSGRELAAALLRQYPHEAAGGSVGEGSPAG